MKSVNLHIKNMVCPSCAYVIENELTKLGVTVDKVEIGFAEVRIHANFILESIEYKLNEFGFELLRNREDQILEKVKTEILEYLNKLETTSLNITLSDHLSTEVGKSYSYLSKLFSSRENKTIEAFYIERKIKRVKEILSYDQLSLGQIAINLGYSSVHYLSNQFKKVTGMSVSQYKEEINKKNEMKNRRRNRSLFGLDIDPKVQKLSQRKFDELGINIALDLFDGNEFPYIN